MIKVKIEKSEIEKIQIDRNPNIKDSGETYFIQKLHQTFFLLCPFNTSKLACFNNSMYVRMYQHSKVEKKANGRRKGGSVRNASLVVLPE